MLSQLDIMLKELVDMGKEADLDKKSVDATEIIKNAVQELRISQNIDSTAITVDLDHSLPLWVDKAQFGRAFSNILLNAMQAKGRDGNIWIRSKASGVGKSMVEFCIGNTGSFIPEEDRQKIFNIFYTTGQTSGSGLGLAIAQKVVRSHGGNIWCDSSVERGTEFYFTFPVVVQNGALSKETVATTKESMPPLAPAAFPKKATERVIKALVIDDENIFSDHAAQLLSACGKPVDVVRCADSSAAINTAKALNPDIVVCDVELGKNSLDGVGASLKASIFAGGKTHPQEVAGDALTRQLFPLALA